MAEDPVTPIPEEPLLEISAEEVAAEAPPPAGAAPAVPPVPPTPAIPQIPPPPLRAPAPPVAPELALPVAPWGAHGDDQEVILIQGPAAPAGPLAPAPPLVVEAEPAAAPPAPVAYQPPAPAVLEPPTPQPAAYAPAVVQPQPPTPEMATEQWYTGSGGQWYGPYSSADLRAWLHSGQVSWDTVASRGGDDPGRPLSAIAEFNPLPGLGLPPGALGAAGAKDKTVAGVLGIVLGAFGAHHWYLGNYALAGIYLGVGLFTVGTLPAIAGIIEGIIYLTAPDDRFQRNYHKWFLNGP